MITGILVGLMLMMMSGVLVYSWGKLGDFRKALLATLIIGKLWAGAMWAFGIDHPLFNIIVYNKKQHITTVHTITADEFVFLSFLTSFAFALSWPYIQPYLPEKIREVGL